jgi:hypothetical protein
MCARKKIKPLKCMCVCEGKMMQKTLLRGNRVNDENLSRMKHIVIACSTYAKRMLSAFTAFHFSASSSLASSSPLRLRTPASALASTLCSALCAVPAFQLFAVLAPATPLSSILLYPLILPFQKGRPRLLSLYVAIVL